MNGETIVELMSTQGVWQRREDIGKRVWEVRSREKGILIFDLGNDEYELLAAWGFSQEEAEEFARRAWVLEFAKCC